MTATEIAPGLVIKGFKPPLNLNNFKLIAFDMDSTLINIECVDEIADAVGRMAEVAAITEATMRGEITDFKESLRQRVALLKGVTLADMERVFKERLQLNPGAAELVAACKEAGMKVLLVSGGFTYFADRVRDLLQPALDRLGVSRGAHPQGQRLAQRAGAELAQNAAYFAELGLLQGKGIHEGVSTLNRKEAIITALSQPQAKKRPEVA